MTTHPSQTNTQTYRDALAFNQFTLHSAIDEIRNISNKHDHRKSKILTRGCLACLAEKLRRVAELNHDLLRNTDMNNPAVVTERMEKAVSVYIDEKS